MKRLAIVLLKLVVVATLMWLVFRTIHFEDRLVWRRAADLDVVVQEQVIEIVGPWKREPVTYTLAGDPEQRRRTASRGPTGDGLALQVEPGFLTYWQHLDPWWFALGASCYFLTVLIAGTRWWWLLRVNGTDVSLRETLRFTWIGVFFNSVVPGATGGDVIKAIYIMKRCAGHRVQVLVSVIVDRVLGLASLALLGAVVVLFALDRFPEIAVAIWGVIGGVGLLGVVAFSKRLRNLVRLKWLLERLPARLGGVLKLIDQAVFFYRDHKVVIGASLLAGVGNHVISVGSVVCIGHSLGIELPTFEYFVLIPVINIVSVVPLMPNGWGLGEWLYKGLFEAYGAPFLPGVPNAAQAMGTRGVALSVLYRLHLTFWSLLGGLFVLFEKDRVTKADIDREVELERHEAGVEPPEPGR
ncbi:MAG: flippase-like domain-containing protein [Planctomycetes bacterium]|nr:flippase-like domain-containing protein [Planctomycetota bacterium]